MKFAVVAFSVIILFSCANNESIGDLPFHLEFKGALKNIMQKGDLTAKVDLSEFRNVNNLYALGAIENLKGEIQIFDSEPCNSSVENGEIKLDSTYSKKATLLVSAVVKNWISFPIPEQIHTKVELQRYLEKTASENGIDTDLPFPFLIQGRVEELKWHVINWKEGDTEHSHDKHVVSGLNGTLVNEEVDLLGFYSNKHHAIFTHHSTNMHIHMKSNKVKISGHVDDLLIGKSMTLKLPQQD